MGPARIALRSLTEIASTRLAERTARREAREHLHLRKGIEATAIEEAAVYCSSVLRGIGVLDAIEEQARSYVGDHLWEVLTRHWGRHPRRCAILARLAQVILDAKRKLHLTLGWFASEVVMRLTLVVTGVRHPVLGKFVTALITNLPIPVVDQKLTAVARGVQLTGIVICLVNDHDLTRCACFVDLVIEGGKEFAKKLVLAGTQDWAGLGELGI